MTKARLRGYPMMVVLSSLALAGCGPDLSGRWKGGMSCDGEELWEFAMDLDPVGAGGYTGPGAAEVICEGVDDWCILEWRTAITTAGTNETQQLDMALDDCSVSYGDETTDSECYTPKYVVLRGGTRIEGYLDSCVFSVSQ